MGDGQRAYMTQIRNSYKSLVIKHAEWNFFEHRSIHGSTQVKWALNK